MADIYVSTTGSDTDRADGGSAAQPWATIQGALTPKTTGTHASAGDTIYMVEGVYPDWSGSGADTLSTNQESGAQGNPIAIRPDPTNTGDVEIQSLNLYSISYLSFYNIIFDRQGAGGKYLDLGDPNNEIICNDILFNGVTFRNGDGGSGATSFIRFQFCDGVEFDNCTWDNNRGRAGGVECHANIFRKYIKNLHIHNCLFRDSGGDHIQMQEYSGGARENIIIEGNTFEVSDNYVPRDATGVEVPGAAWGEYCGEEGIDIKATNTAGGPIIIRNNKFRNFRGRLPGSGQDQTGGGGRAVILHINSGGSTSDVQIYGNEVENCEGFLGCALASQRDINMQCYSNKVYDIDNPTPAIGAFRTLSERDWIRNNIGFKFYNNVLDYKGAIRVLDVSHNADTEMYNNIWVAEGSNVNHAAGTAGTYDHNMWSGITTVASVEGANDVAGPPVFDADRRLDPLSPGIDEGTPIIPNIEDYDGLLYDSVPNIGCYALPSEAGNVKMIHTVRFNTPMIGENAVGVSFLNGATPATSVAYASGSGTDTYRYDVEWTAAPVPGDTLTVNFSGATIVNGEGEAMPDGTHSIENCAVQTTDVVVAQVTVQMPTANDASLDITTTDLGGRTPKGWLAYATIANNDGTPVTTACYSMGFGTPTTNFSMCGSSEAALGGTARNQGATQLVYLRQPDVTIGGTVTVNNAIVNGINVNFSLGTPTNSQSYMTFVFFAGDDVSCAALEQTLPLGASDVTLGIQPDMLFVMGHSRNTWVASSSAFVHTIGLATRGSGTAVQHQGAVVHRAENANNRNTAAQSDQFFACKPESGTPGGNLTVNALTATGANITAANGTSAYDATAHYAFFAVNFNGKKQVWSDFISVPLAPSAQGYTTGFTPGFMGMLTAHNWEMGSPTTSDGWTGSGTRPTTGGWMSYDGTNMETYSFVSADDSQGDPSISESLYSHNQFRRPDANSAETATRVSEFGNPTLDATGFTITFTKANDIANLNLLTWAVED